MWEITKQLIIFVNRLFFWAPIFLSPLLFHVHIPYVGSIYLSFRGLIFEDQQTKTRITIKPTHITFGSDTYIFHFKSNVGSIEIHDSLKEGILIKVNDIHLGTLKGDLEYQGLNMTFTGLYEDTKVSYSRDGRGKSLKLQGKNLLATLSDEPPRFEVQSKFISPGITDLSIIGQKPYNGKFKGCFYQEKFSGTIDGTINGGKGSINTQFGQAQLEWNEEILQFKNHQLSGELKIKQKIAYLKVGNNYAQLTPETLQIVGPDACFIVKNGEKLEIQGAWMRYSHNLINDILLAESINAMQCETKPQECKITFYDFQGVNIALTSTDRYFYAILSNGANSLNAFRLGEFLDITCSEISQFSHLIGRSIVTGGKLSIKGKKRGGMWNGSLEIKNAKLIERYVPFHAVNTWTVKSTWKATKSLLEIKANLISTNGSVINIEGSIDIQKNQVTLRGWVFRKTLVSSFLPRWSTKLRFSVNGTLNSPFVEQNPTNVLLGWINLLPI